MWKVSGVASRAALTARPPRLISPVSRGDGAVGSIIRRVAVSTIVQLTPATIQFVDEGKSFRVSAESLRLTVAKELKHDPTCGGKQWFHPLSTVDDAAMGTTAENAFSGTALGTKWSDPDKRSGFFGRFSY
jgi:hypothetical protein